MWKSTVALLMVMSACSSDDGSDSDGDDAAATEDGSSSSTSSDSSSTDLLPPETESSGGVDPTSIDATLSAGSSSESGGTDCTTLDPAACERAPDCVTIMGSAFVPDRSGPDAWCLDAPTPIACRNAEDNCDALLTYACDEKGTAYEVGSDCIPRPWSVCDPPMMGAPDC